MLEVKEQEVGSQIRLVELVPDEMHSRDFAHLCCVRSIILPLTPPLTQNFQTQILRAELVSLRQVGVVMGDGDKCRLSFRE